MSMYGVTYYTGGASMFAIIETGGKQIKVEGRNLR